MDYSTYSGVLRSHGHELAVAARAAPLDTRVPSCPGWTLLDLVSHLGIHHRWVAGNLDRTPDQGMFPFGEIEDVPDGQNVADWLDAGVEMLAAKLETTDPDTPCWTWAVQPTARFWARRTAHETVVHSWDGCNAAGTAGSIAQNVAVDGIDEYLTLVPLRSWEPAVRGSGETIQIRSLDAPAAWRVVLDDSGMHVTPASGSSDVTVSGDASSVFLYLLGRGPADSVDINGDRNVLDSWREVAKF